jgi:hypothetical protein
MLREYLSDEDPLYIIRWLKEHKRGTIYRTGHNLRIWPTDNAPVWWTHALLHSEKVLPEDLGALIKEMPYDFHSVARHQTLNQAGYHAAHILSAKNGNTDWQNWTRAELARRMLVNIHPCNVFLVAKQEWQSNGGRPDIIAWITRAYLRRYGATMERFLEGAPGNWPINGPADDPIYQYSGDAIDQRTQTRPASFLQPRPQASTPVRQYKRPAIWRELVGKGFSLELSMQGTQYVLPHDHLVNWAREHTNALNTPSWKDRGHYNWRNPSKAMLQFLQDCKNGNRVITPADDTA